MTKIYFLPYHYLITQTESANQSCKSKKYLLNLYMQLYSNILVVRNEVFEWKLNSCHKVILTLGTDMNSIARMSLNVQLLSEPTQLWSLDASVCRPSSQCWYPGLDLSHCCLRWWFPAPAPARTQHSSSSLSSSNNFFANFIFCNKTKINIHLTVLLPN